MEAFPRSAHGPEIEASWAEQLVRRGALDDAVRYAGHALQLATDLGAPAAQMAALKAMAAIETQRGNDRVATDLRAEASKLVAGRGDAVLLTLKWEPT